MNAGNKARELGFYGIMNSVEDIMVARDLLLAKNTGAKLIYAMFQQRTA